MKKKFALNNLKRNTLIGLTVNLLYAIGNCAVGIATSTWWFITLGVYYLTLSLARAGVLLIHKKADGIFQKENLAKILTGYLLVFLSLCLTGIITLSAIDGRGTHYHEIIMIAIAAYTFTKVPLAIAGLVKSRKVQSPTIKTLRNISFADGFVSIYSLQRSMLVSFPGMRPEEIKIFNILTGTAVWLLVLILGINLIGGKRITMAKAKIVKKIEKISDAVTGGYKKIEKGVVDGYKKVESTAVNSYTKIEDKFVDSFLTKDGETVEQAKERIKKDIK